VAGRPSAGAGRGSGTTLRIAFNVKPVAGPWGGGNQFVAQLSAWLRARGHTVSFRLWPWIERILLIAPRPFQHVTFDVDAIRRFKERHPSVTCVHRINQTSLGRGAANVDDLFRAANDVADETIFISAWVRDYFAARWFDPGRPHTVIHNGADPSLFYPAPDAWSSGAPLRIVTHHWSDNRNKGFATYQEIDRLIAAGELPGYELTVVGRWPGGVTWRAAKTIAPLPPRALGDELRRHHLYLTAAVAEAGGMHHIEGAQCGLPLVYHEDGGGVVELARQYGVGFRADDVRSALVTARRCYGELRERVLRLAPSGARMCEEYARVLTG
jgi:glycosyltransferase involved in cell wall biosynthesis